MITHSNVDGGQSPVSSESNLKAKPGPSSVGGLPYNAKPRKADTELGDPGFEAKIRQEMVEGPAKTAEKLVVSLTSPEHKAEGVGIGRVAI